MVCCCQGLHINERLLALFLVMKTLKAYTFTCSGAENHRKSTEPVKPGFYMSYYSCKLFAI